MDLIKGMIQDIHVKVVITAVHKLLHLFWLKPRSTWLVHPGGQMAKQHSFCKFAQASSLSMLM
jgi:hypothetical protein